MIITIPSFGLGKTGGDRVLIALANNLSNRGHTVNIINLGNKPLPFTLSKQVNLKSIPFNVSKKDPLSFIIKGINKLARNLPASDIYLANWVYPVLPCIANNEQGKTAFLAQANEAKDFKKASLKILNGISYEAYKLNIPIITPSVYLQNIILKRFRNNSTVIPPFVNTKIFKPKLRTNRNKKLKLLFVGNAKNEQKGFGLLLKACQKLHDVPFELHLATQSDLKFDHAKIDFYLHKPKDDQELAKVYKQCDMFFNLSREEGFGLTLLEAMASGLICVTTDSGGVKDFAINNKNCIVVKRNVQSILSIIKLIHNNSGKFQRLLEANAIKTAKLYTEKRMINSFERLFSEMR